MARAKSIKPYQQGDLDLFCGLYAVVNACQWGLRYIDPMHTASSKALFEVLFASLNSDPQKLQLALSDGISAATMGRVLKIARRWLKRERGIEVDIRKPLHRKRKVSLHKYVSKIETHLVHSNTAAIVLSAGQLNHWTVVTHTNQNTLRLLDSCGRSHFRRAKWTCASVSDCDENHLQFVPNGLFALRFSSSK